MEASRSKFFFDRQAVIDAVGKDNARRLSKAGSLVWRTAKNSLRKAPASTPAQSKRKNARPKFSRPGSPPYSRTGTLKQLTFFSLDPASNSVVIGPEKAASGTADIIEYGGSETIKDAKTGKSYQANYQPRPWIGPALEKATAMGAIPSIWSNG